MRKLNLFKSGLTALMMAFAMTLCFSCCSDDDEEEVPSDNAFSSLQYDVQLTSRYFSERKFITNQQSVEVSYKTHEVYVGDTLSLSVKPRPHTEQPKSVDAWDDCGMISFDKKTNKVFIDKKKFDGQTTLTVKITDPSGESVSGKFYLHVNENN